MSKFGIVEKHFEYKGHDSICVFTSFRWIKSEAEEC